LKVKISIINDTIVVVKVKGELSIFDEEFDLFAKEVVAYSKMGIYRFVMDLDEVTYIDSSGVGVVIRLATSAMKMDSKVCVICSSPAVRRVFVVSNVDRILKFVETVDEGMKFFESSTPVSE
jgi:anti-anti-sigma factor